MNISQLKDRHKDKTCIIMGAGPSLHLLNENDISDDIVVICVNSSIKKFINRCDYFVTDDWDVTNWDYWKEVYDDKSVVKLLYKDKFLKIKERDDIVFYNHRNWNANKEDLSTLVISSDPNVPIIGARTSVGSALNLAHIMGCENKFLVGVDTSFLNDNRYYWQFDGEKKCQRLDGTINRILKTDHTGEFKRYFDQLKRANPEINYNNLSGYLCN